MKPLVHDYRHALYRSGWWCRLTYANPCVSTEDTAYDVDVAKLTPDVVYHANSSRFIP